jgi:hypothetical protein
MSVCVCPLLVLVAVFCVGRDALQLIRITVRAHVCVCVFINLYISMIEHQYDGRTLNERGDARQPGMLVVPHHTSVHEKRCYTPTHTHAQN